MTIKTKTAFAAALFAMGLGATLPAAAQTQSCIAPINFDSWRSVNDHTVVLTDKRRHDWRVSLAPGCFNLDFALGIGVKSFTTSRLQCISRGDYIVVPRDVGMPGERCMITKVEPYTAEMAHDDAVAKAMKQNR